MYDRIISFVISFIIVITFLSGASTAQMTDVTVAAGLDGVTGTEGTAWGDYDGDGDFDLFVSRKGFYRNNGDGTFTDVTGSVFLDPVTPLPLGVAWADYNHDGHLDLFITGGFGSPSNLFRNNGNGTMTDVAVAAGINAPDAVSPAWADYDNDGDLDLYVARIDADNQLYRNNGDGTFTDMASSAGVTNPNSESRSADFGDYDNDGDVDLYVVNSINGTNRADALYRNNGDGTFTDVISDLGMDNTGDGVGVSWGDYDNDCDLDLYISARGGERLFQNNGDGTFTDVTGVAGVGVRSALPQWVDYDNDGDQDLSLINGQSGGNNLFRNTGDGSFADEAANLGINDTGVGIGGGWADYDNDGDLDLYISNGGNGDNRLFRNDLSNSNNSLQIELVGLSSNRSSIGASIKTDINGQKQFKVVNGGHSSQMPLPILFGLGTATTIDTITITWPSGIVRTLRDVPISQPLTIAEQFMATFDTDDSFASPGNAAVVGIRITAADSVAGIQFTVQPQDDGQPTNSASLQGVINHLQNQGFTATVGSPDSSGKTTVHLFSPSGASIPSPNALNILEMVFNIDGSTPPGKQIDLDISDVTLSDSQNIPFFTTVSNGSMLIGKRGDLAGGALGNGDGVVSVLDLIKLIKYILGVLPEPSGFVLFVADVNGDGLLNVQDVVATVNQIIGPPPAKVLAAGPVTPVTVNLGNLQIHAGQSVLPIEMTTDGVVAAMQATLTFDPSRMQLGIPMVSGHTSNMVVDHHVADGVMQFMVYSADGHRIEPGRGTMLFIPVTMSEAALAAPVLTLTDVLVVDAQAQRVTVHLQTDTVKLSSSIPGSFSLGVNYPNPFNPTTTISYEVPQQAHITLAVYNLLGQEVVKMVDSVVTPGRYQVLWDGANAQGHGVASGIYMYRITSSTGFRDTKRMLLLK